MTPDPDVLKIHDETDDIIRERRRYEALIDQAEEAACLKETKDRYEQGSSSDRDNYASLPEEHRDYLQAEAKSREISQAFDAGYAARRAEIAAANLGRLHKNEPACEDNRQDDAPPAKTLLEPERREDSAKDDTGLTQSRHARNGGERKGNQSGAVTDEIQDGSYASQTKLGANTRHEAPSAQDANNDPNPDTVEQEEPGNIRQPHPREADALGVDDSVKRGQSSAEQSKPQGGPKIRFP